MKWRALAFLALALFAAPLAAEAQQAGKVYRMGYLTPGGYQLFDDGFAEALRGLGWVGGQNLVVERREFGGRFERLPALAAELVGLGVDVIVAVGNGPALAAKQATSTIPIVMAPAADPVGSGLVASLARPGGNVTGLSWDVTLEEVGKRLQLLKESVPGLSRIAGLMYPITDPAVYGQGAARRDQQVRQDVGLPAARKLGVQLQRVEVRRPEELEPAFAAIRKGRAGAIIVLHSAFTYAHRRQILDLVAQSGLPALYQTREWVKAGGLMSYGPSGAELYQRTAAYVDKILKGAKPAELPVEQPTRFDIFINLKTAGALGLLIPRAVLMQASDVIQ